MARLAGFTLKTTGKDNVVMDTVGVRVNEQNFYAPAVAAQLLKQLREEASTTTGLTRRRLRRAGNQEAALLLFPHGHLFRPSKWHWPWRKYRRWGNKAEREVAAGFVRQLQQELQTTWDSAQVPPANGKSSDKSPGPGQPALAASENHAAGYLPANNSSLAVALGLRQARVSVEVPASNQYRLRLATTDKWRNAARTPVVDVHSESWTNGGKIPTAEDLASQLADGLLQKISPTAKSQFISSAKSLTLQLLQDRVRQDSTLLRSWFLTEDPFTLAKVSKGLLSLKDEGFTLLTNNPQLTKARFIAQYNRLLANQKALRDFQSNQLSPTKLSTLSDSLNAEDTKVDLLNVLTPVVMQLLAPLQPAKVAPASNIPNLLYSGQQLLPTTPTRRVARIYIHDRGEGGAATHQARYVVCLYYTATNGTFQDTNDSPSECGAIRGYVGVSLELAALERTAFVEGLGNALMAKQQQLETTAAVEAKDSSTVGLKQSEMISAQKIDVGKVATDTKSSVILTQQQQLLMESLRDIYDDYIRQQERLYATPRAGVVLLGQRLYVYCGGDNDTTSMPPARPDLFAIDSVMMEAEDGSALGIKAYGTYMEQAILFETYAPLNLSSDFDLKKRWYNTRLYAQGSFYRTLSNEKDLYIKLEELMRYYPLLLARSSDRSPADAVYTFRPQDPLPKRVLKKVPTTKILQARVFTDLLGIANDRPNGLLQLELSKKFILYNTFPFASRRAQFGFFTYIMPAVSINKIEKNNRQLPLSPFLDADNQPQPGLRGVRTIDLLRFTNLRLGLGQNLVSWKVPAAKSDFCLDMLAYLGRVAVRDTIGQAIPRDSTLNTMTYGPQLVWRVRPDSRYGFQFRAAMLVQNLFNDSGTAPGITAIERAESGSRSGRPFGFLSKVVPRTSEQTILQYELMLWAKVSDNSDLFFRTQFSHLRYYPSNTFFQLQIGYQFDVFTTQRSAVMPAGLMPK